MTNAVVATDQNETLTQFDFARIADVIQQASGIKMPASKTVLLEGRLRRRLRATGHATIAAYCTWLFSAGVIDDELVHLLNAVTTNKTDFFREERHFDYLSQVILPSLPPKRQGRLHVWSAACSIGAEPYTLAMVLTAFAAENQGPGFDILATDIDTEALAAARRGVFPADMLPQIPQAYAGRYVRRAKAPAREEFRIVPALRSTIGFGRVNLVDERYPVPHKMDVIFCRNVLIYFERPLQLQVVSRLADCLAPGGHLFLGHSESIAGANLPLSAVSNTVFRRN